MSNPLFNLQSSGVWTQVYDQSRQATPITQTTWFPLDAFEVGFLLEKHVLAVRCLSQSAKPHWRFAGNLVQRFQIGTGGASSPLPLVEATRIFMRLNRTALIRFPRLTSNYELILEPPYWLQDLRLTIWEYSGIDDDLERIESKVDAL